MSDILDTVRRFVGDRETISRAEMRDILAELPGLADNSTIGGRFEDGSLYVGGSDYDESRHVRPVTVDAPDIPPSMREIDREATYAAEQRATGTAWANMCRDILCISVVTYSDGYQVRYDAPGSMAPMQHAAVTFCDAERVHDEHGTVDYLRDHADRVLLVNGDRL